MPAQEGEGAEFEAPVVINWDMLYRSADGREAWIIYNIDKELAFIVTDIHGQGAPANAVGFTAAMLRRIADDLEAGISSSRNDPLGDTLDPRGR